MSALFDFKFSTFDLDDVPSTLTSATVAVYKDNSLTQSTTGVTLTTDFDGQTGLNNVRIDTSADGTFYSAGSCFELVLTAGTVDGAQIGPRKIPGGFFTIEKTSALRPTVAGRTLDVTATGAAGVDWANVENPTTTVGLTGTTVGLIDGAVTAAKIGASALAQAKFASDYYTAITALLVAHDGPALPTGTVTTDAGNSPTQFETDRTESVNDYWKDALCLITSGALAGQVKKVTGYNGTTKILSFTNGYTGTPADGVTFVLINR